MEYLVIGDVHGCYYTLKKLITENHQNETIIFLGDYIDRGLHGVATLKYLLNLKNRDNRVILLRGNHEQEFIEKYLCYTEEKKNIDLLYNAYPFLHGIKKNIKEIVDLFSHLPLFFETDFFFTSHAGVSSFPSNSLDPNDPCGLLWNRMALKNLNKLQIHGHTPTIAGPLYNELSNSWNVDTGACFNGYLSAIKINNKGNVVKIIKVKTIEDDIYLCSC